ncbi:MAG: hypothetical protein JWL62_1675 [Hyphomicrobiales bacterium]|nr:hypothetical protein [Hyphomicrobiales bacterium]
MDIHWKILLGLLAFPALIAGILSWLHIQNFRTRNWLEASGRIRSSKAVAKTVRKLDRDTGDDNRSSTTTERFETKNFAEIAYEFKVANRTFAGSRIDLGPGSGATEVAKVLKRYPQGKIVRVLYDPEDPTSCILERHDSRKLRKGWFAVIVLSAVMVAGVFGIERFGESLGGSMPHPERMPIVIFLSVFGGALALFSQMMGKEERAMQGWTRTMGRIVCSKVETQQQQRDRANLVSFQTLYFPRVVYAYESGGQTWQGDTIGWTVSNSTPDAAQKIVARFPMESKVEVFFDPDDESVSTLDRGGSKIRWVLLAGALLFGCGALATAGLMPFRLNF